MGKRKKISVIGGGNTGATTAFLLAKKGLGDVVLLDLPQFENQAKGKALDMLQAGPVFGFDVSIVGTSDYAQTADSDIVIITAGIARKPGMSRDDLVATNAAVVRAVTTEVVRYSPDCTILVLTNPVDVMTYVAYKASGFPTQRVLGQSGVLDTARFRTFVAEALQVSVRDIHGFVLGGHGDEMVPLVRYASVAGIPLTDLLSASTLEQIVKRTRQGGGEIVGLLGNGSAYYAPAAAMVEMTEAILYNQRRVLPTVAYLNGEYGYADMYFGVPAVIGANGVENIITVQLTKEEQQALDRSATTVRSVLKSIK
ncbi:MAG: malate dehydrogenase [Bacilli bacterium]